MACGTINDFDGFNAQQDCEVLHAAMKGLGTNEAKIIGIVAQRSNKQRMEIKTQYAQMWGKDLIPSLQSELGGHFGEAVLALFSSADEFDAWALYDAMWGLGTTESTLIEIMCSRTNGQIKNIIAAYKRLYKKDLAKDLQGETSGYFKRLLFSLAQASRNEGNDVDYAKAEEDAKALYEAGEKSWGTDESRFNVVMASRSFEQLKLIFKAYEEISKRTVQRAIKCEMSGDVQDGMLAIVKCVYFRPKFFAELLYKSMKGLGTDDKTLVRIMVSRCEVDLVEVMAAFEMMYAQTLEQFIKDDVSGDYKRLMLALCQGNCRIQNSQAGQAGQAGRQAGQ